MKIGRRAILGLGGAAGLAYLLPFARAAHADTRPGAPAKRVMIINLSGGVRSSAAFFASAQKRYNPFGLIGGTGTRIPLGALLDDQAEDAAYTLSPAWNGERVPRFREVAKNLSVLGTWDEERGDHVRARLKETTGSPLGDQAGLLTRLGAALTRARGNLDMLPFHLAPVAAFGQPGQLAEHAPVSLASPRSLPVASKSSAAEMDKTGNDWARDDGMRSRLDERVSARHARNGKTLSDVLALHRRAARTIGGRLAEPWVNVGLDDPAHRDAPFGTVSLAGGARPLTNAMLVELFGKTLGAAGAANPAADSAQNAALAIRLLQLGAPALALEVSGFDLHSQERTMAPPLYAFLGRLWATLDWLLRRVPDPLAPGATLFDTTLVVTMSDFGRDPGSNGSGFNGGEGSDHGADPSCYWLAHAAMGGGVKPGRVIGEVSTDDYRGDRAAQRIDQRGLFATLFWALGLDVKDPAFGLDDVSAPLDALFRA